MKKQILSTFCALNIGLLLPAGIEPVLAVENPTPFSVEQVSSNQTIKESSVATGSSIVATGSSIQVVTPTQATPSNNKNGQNYTNWMNSAGIRSYLYENEDGGLTRVEHIGSKIVVENYDSDFQIQYSGQLDMELPIWGGAYSGKDYNFLVFCQNNLSETNTTEVYRIVKYTKDWQREDSVSLFGLNTQKPLAFGTLKMVQDEDRLYIHTCHNMYKSSDGSNHQANFIISINIPDMKSSVYGSGVGGVGYCSHSLNQFIATDGSVLIRADHGDAYPRSISLTEYTQKADGSFTLSKGRRFNVLKINGSGVYTGVSLGGLVISNQAYLTAGNSAPQVTPYNSGDTRNIFVTSTSREDTSQTQVYWLTNYTKADEVSVSTPHMIKINDNCILVLYTVNGEINYTYLDGEGKQISKINTMEGSLSNCVPILYNNKVVWYYTNNSTPIFCSIDPANMNNTSKPSRPSSSSNSSSDDDSGSSDVFFDSSYNGKGTLSNSEQEKVESAVRNVLGYNTAIASVEKTDTGICIVTKAGDVIYSKNDGSLASNEWEKVGTNWYYFDADKKAAKGWKYLGDKWYYLDDNSSKMVTGWKQTAAGNWYYMDLVNGDMKTEWQFINDKWYYLDPINGDMKTEWQLINGNWYYMDLINGDMKTGWIQWNENWYYMDTENGNCLINTVTPDGYTTDENGAWVY